MGMQRAGTGTAPCLVAGHIPSISGCRVGAALMGAHPPQVSLHPRALPHWGKSAAPGGRQSRDTAGMGKHHWQGELGTMLRGDLSPS